jgi:hypothetical protein
MHEVARFFGRGDLAAEFAHDAGGAFNKLCVAHGKHRG